MTLKVGIRSTSYSQCMACSFITLEWGNPSLSGTCDNIQTSHRSLAIYGIQSQLTWSLLSMGCPSWCHLNKQTKDSLKTTFGSMLTSRTDDPSLSAFRAMWLYGMQRKGTPHLLVGPNRTSIMKKWAINLICQISEFLGIEETTNKWEMSRTRMPG